MAQILSIPLIIDALHLAQPSPVRVPMADFSRLPWRTASGEDRHPEVPYLGASVESEAFAGDGRFLKKGLHLHWALPKAMSRARVQGGQSSFPEVPNRWLISRKPGNAQAPGPAQWIVESDYLYPVGEGKESGAVPFPSRVDPGQQQYEPYRYVGRQLSLEAWLSGDAQAEYLPSLTAVGYGDPLFAAFYPNCSSVFGFHDPMVEEGAEVLYEIVGWFANPEKDFLKVFVESYAAEYRSLHEGRDPSPAELQQAVEEQLDWKFDLPAGVGFPTESLYYGQVVLAKGATEQEHPGLSSHKLKVSIGNTASEAFAASLARQINPKEADLVEDQLEAVLHRSRLDAAAKDHGLQLRELRHASSFSEVDGPEQWVIRSQSQQDLAKDSAGDKSGEPRLSAELAHGLARFNGLYRQWDLAKKRIESLRRHLYWDWYRYMMAAYPAAGREGDLPSPESIRFFIRKRSIPDLLEAQHQWEDLSWQWDDEENLLGLSCAQGMPDSLAGQVVEAGEAVLVGLAAFNQAHADQGRCFLRREPGPRFQVPREPVVVLEGEVVKPGLRHAPDGPLEGQCFESLYGPEELVRSHRESLENQMATWGDPQSDKEPGLTVVRHRPWNPVFMEWECGLEPVSKGSNLEAGDRNFSPYYVTENFALGDTQVDLEVRDTADYHKGGATRYRGISLVVLREPKGLEEQIDAYLQEQGTEAASPSASGNSPRSRAGSLKQNLEAAKALIGAQKGKVMGQSLSGINEAFLMLRSSLQLPVEDPMAFPGEEGFTKDEVAPLVGNTYGEAPMPDQDFLPIRSGLFSLERLRLVDSFGRMVDADLSHLQVAASLRTPVTGGRINLPPRLVQPARLFTEVLQSAPSGQEASPVQGWLLHDRFDGILKVYDAEGSSLGAINGDGVYEGTAMLPEDLAKLLWRIQREGNTGVFRQNLDQALESIDPADRSDPMLSLLSSRPLALIRLSVDLHLRDLPAAHQGWIPFDLSQKLRDREDNDFPLVRFPLRLGAYGALEDGVVCFWEENEAGEPGKVHYLYEERERDFPSLQLRLREGAKTLWVLADPRAPLHVSCGILPMQKIQIPVRDYQEALKKIHLQVQAGPLLTATKALQFPLAQEPGYSWKWQDPGKSPVDLPHTQAKLPSFPYSIRAVDGKLSLESSSPSTETN